MARAQAEQGLPGTPAAAPAPAPAPAPTPSRSRARAPPGPARTPARAPRAAPGEPQQTPGRAKAAGTPVAPRSAAAKRLDPPGSALGSRVKRRRPNRMAAAEQQASGAADASAAEADGQPWVPHPAGSGARGDSEGAVRVFVRGRPAGADKTQVVQFAEDAVQMDGRSSFRVDGSFGPEADQRAVYGGLRDQIDGFFDGYNSTLLLYGQTGSGKTYTAGTQAEKPRGDGLEVDPGTGILPRFLAELFEHCSRTCIEWECAISMVEIYKEEMRDLLDPTPKTVKLFKHGGHVKVQGLSEERVCNLQQALDVLYEGCSVRATGATNMNEHSSRSHAIVTVSLQQLRHGVEGHMWQRQHVSSKFNFVDLAGSESMKRTQAEGQRAEELININKGLLQLALVIEQLAKGCLEGGSTNTNYVPYRDSKLTRYLEDSLGGNSSTVMIACISPEEDDASETTNTLRYACQARNIKNRPKKNVTLDDTAQQVITLSAENDELQRRIACLEEQVDSQKLQLEEKPKVEFEEKAVKVNWRAVVQNVNGGADLDEHKRELKESLARALGAEDVDAHEACGQFAVEALRTKARSAGTGQALEKVQDELELYRMLTLKKTATSGDESLERPAVKHLREMPEAVQDAWAALTHEKERLQTEVALVSRELSLVSELHACPQDPLIAQIWSLQECVSKLRVEQEKQMAVLTGLVGTLGRHAATLGEEYPFDNAAGKPISGRVAACKEQIRKAELLIDERLQERDAHVDEVKHLVAQLGGCDFEDGAMDGLLQTVLQGGGALEALGLTNQTLTGLVQLLELVRNEKGLRAAEFNAMQKVLSQYLACIECCDTEDMPDLNALESSDTVDMDAVLSRAAMRAKEEDIRAREAQLQSAFDARLEAARDIWGQVGKEESAREEFVQSLEGLGMLDKFVTLHREFRNQYQKMECLRPLLSKIQERENLVEQMAAFELRASDPNRLKSRSRGVFKELQEEENFRKKIKKLYPKLRDQILELVIEWERLEGEDFMFNGEQYRTKLQSEDVKSSLLHLKTINGGKQGKPLQARNANSRPASARPARLKQAPARRGPGRPQTARPAFGTGKEN